ncbi:FAD-dependent thymidylate synthase [Inquilinus limosus]|uniref:Thymidylate synthase n=1 Tax=Inquilinus limosus MP06 TaxID=1398085 RepID=A0A0A0DDI9_9PROT|nr:FAD-dependent thymidylate synthase [Inquilinus limosus]KGM36110.1 hypothetical protein P409_00220 [Inquilinus limosus MP06]
MTTISAKVLAHSVAEGCPPIITMQLRYPRVIHAEFMTHRVFSRNASSSRAVPVQRLIEDVERDPYVPLHWGKNQPGMQAREEHNEPVMLWAHDAEEHPDPFTREQAWREACHDMVEIARAFAKAGYHKQIVNRLLEPFSHINVVCTATDWNNFYALRRHEDAEPHIKMLADAMWEAQQASKPVELTEGQWHLPYVTEHDWIEINGGGVVTLDQKIALRFISAARCARVSYLTHDGRQTTLEEDLALAQRLLDSGHMSPFEHQAIPDMFSFRSCQNSPKWGNFRQWVQHRHIL